ncbi:TPM domain-containing protein [Longitalea arenae]|uniref:TPM domain-containing protein n=1 Tax=Longitalea arenae TaxID=2812558 RepID=UPI001F07A5B1|nr:TPM domain-containing protein [Longitalea arenae]
MKTGTASFSSKKYTGLIGFFLVISVVFNSFCAFAQITKAPSFVRPLPVPHRAVNDFAKFVNENEKALLEKELVAYHTRTGNAIVFISLDSLTDPATKKQYTIEEAARLYFNTWGIGDSIKNNGVLIMASKSPRRVRIEVGKGLEIILTNEFCQQIIDEKLVPNFKQGSFFAGIKEAVEAIVIKLDSTPGNKKGHL